MNMVNFLFFQIVETVPEEQIMMNTANENLGSQCPENFFADDNEICDDPQSIDAIVTVNSEPMINGIILAGTNETTPEQILPEMNDSQIIEGKFITK